MTVHQPKTMHTNKTKRAKEANGMSRNNKQKIRQHSDITKYYSFMHENIKHIPHECVRNGPYFFYFRVTRPYFMGSLSIFLAVVLYKFHLACNIAQK